MRSKSVRVLGWFGVTTVVFSMSAAGCTGDTSHGGSTGTGTGKSAIQLGSWKGPNTSLGRQKAYDPSDESTYEPGAITSGAGGAALKLGSSSAGDSWRNGGDGTCGGDPARLVFHQAVCAAAGFAGAPGLSGICGPCDFRVYPESPTCARGERCTCETAAHELGQTRSGLQCPVPFFIESRNVATQPAGHTSCDGPATDWVHKGGDAFPAQFLGPIDVVPFFNFGTPWIGGPSWGVGSGFYSASSGYRELPSGVWREGARNLLPIEDVSPTYPWGRMPGLIPNDSFGQKRYSFTVGANCGGGCGFLPRDNPGRIACYVSEFRITPANPTFMGCTQACEPQGAPYAHHPDSKRPRKKYLPTRIRPPGLNQGSNGTATPAGFFKFDDPVTLGMSAYMDESFATLEMPDGLGGEIGLRYRSDQVELGIGSPALSATPGWSRTYGRHLVLPGSEGQPPPPPCWTTSKGLECEGVRNVQQDPMVLVSDVGERHVLHGVPKVAIGGNAPYVTDPDVVYRDLLIASFEVAKQPDGTWIVHYPNGNADVFLADGTLSEMHDTSGNTLLLALEEGPCTTCTAAPGAPPGPPVLERVLSFTRFYADGTKGPRLEEVYRNGTGAWLLHALRDGVTAEAPINSATRREVLIRRDGASRIAGFKDEHGGVWTFGYKDSDPRIWHVYDPNNDPSDPKNTAPECVETSFDGMYGVSTQTTGVCPNGQPAQSPRTTVAYVNQWSDTEETTREFRILRNAGRADQRMEVFYRNKEGQTTKRCAPNSTSKCATFEYDGRGSLTAEVDADGVRTEYQRSPEGWLTNQMVDPTGARITTTYDRNSIGLPTLIGEVGKPPITFTYDSTYRGLLLSTTSGATSARRTTTYTRNGRGQVTHTQLPDGRVDASDPLAWGETRASLPALDTNGLNLSAGQVSRDWLGQTTSVVDARGRLSVMTYSAGGRLTTTALASGPATEYRYDAIGNPTRVISVASGETRETKTDYVMTGHDAQYKPSRITDALGNVSTLTYDSYGELASTQDAEGRTTSFSRTYGTDGLLTVTQTDALGATTTSVFSPAGRPLSTTDARGVKTVSTYNAAGRLVSVRTGAAATTDGKPAVSEEVRFQYDARGRVSRVIDAAGRPSDSSYDTQDRLIQSKDAAGRTVDRTYDDNGKLLSETVAGSAQRTEWSYDAITDRLRETRVFQGGQLISSSSVSYDSLGRALSTSTLARGERHSVTREFDNASPDPFAVQREVDDRGRETLYTYDALGAVYSLSRTGTEPLYYGRNGWGETINEYRGAALVTHKYDALGRAVSLTEAGKTESWTYDKSGRLKTQTDLGGKTTAFAYDLTGRLATKSTADGSVTWRYLSNGLLDSLIDADGTTTYEYDAANRLVSRARGNHSTAYKLAPGGLLARITQNTPLGARTTDVARDAVGNFKSLATDGRNALSWQRDTLDRITASDYDGVWKSSLNRSAGELTGSRHDSKTSFSLQTSLERKNGQLSARSFVWGFPNTPRLTTEKETFTYDSENDQLAKSTYDFDDSFSNVGLQGSGGIGQGPGEGLFRTFSHPADARGNLTVSPDGLTPLPIDPTPDRLSAPDFESDAAGNLTKVTLATGQSWTFAYDAENRLVRSLHDGFTTRYTYDGAGNLTFQSLTHPDNTTVESTTFVLDETVAYPRVAAELRSDRSEVHYVYGPTGLAMRRILKPGAPEVQQYALLDHLGSVRAWTTKDGIPSNWLRFDPYGILMENTGTDSPYRSVTLVASRNNKDRRASASWGRPFRFSPPAVALVDAAAAEGPSLELLLPDGSKATCSYEAASPDGSSLKRPLVDCKDPSGNVMPATFDIKAVEIKRLQAFPDSDVRVDIAELLPSGKPAPEFSGLGFTGEWTGPDGTVFLRARHYLPAIGRFLQRDSFAGLAGDSLSRNRYAYARNQPLDLVDPSGHFPKAWNWLVSLDFFNYTPKYSFVSKFSYEGTGALGPIASGPGAPDPELFACSVGLGSCNPDTTDPNFGARVDQFGKDMANTNLTALNLVGPAAAVRANLATEAAVSVLPGMLGDTNPLLYGVLIAGVRPTTLGRAVQEFWTANGLKRNSFLAIHDVIHALRVPNEVRGYLSDDISLADLGQQLQIQMVENKKSLEQVRASAAVREIADDHGLHGHYGVDHILDELQQQATLNNRPLAEYLSLIANGTADDLLFDSSIAAHAGDSYLHYPAVPATAGNPGSPAITAQFGWPSSPIVANPRLPPRPARVF
jgi:RHS repeat-associated protein